GQQVVSVLNHRGGDVGSRAGKRGGAGRAIGQVRNNGDVGRRNDGIRIAIDSKESGSSRILRETETLQQAVRLLEFHLRRYVGFPRRCLAQAQPFVGGKEEGLILLDGPTQRPTELVPVEARDGRTGSLNRIGRAIGLIEEILGIQVAVAHELKPASVELVSAAL